ncbi:hypothetical protein RQP46_007780 [Phenoliferia psychrophenolica]
MLQAPSDRSWWREAIIYEIYPASFKDSTGSGLGDLQGLLEKLDYIESLGTLTLLRISPQNDFGYDISDYHHVHEPYGSMETIKAVINQCHQRHLHVIFDLIDGFRIDTVNMYSKHGFADAAVVDSGERFQPAGHLLTNGPRLHEYLREMKRDAFDKDGAISIGELPDTPDLDQVLEFVSHSRAELDTCIQFDLAKIDCDETRVLHLRPWKLSDFKRITIDSQLLAGEGHDGWPMTYTENHDRARSVSRFASDSPRYRAASAKMLCLYLLTLSGSTIVHQGQEIGMINMPSQWPMDEYKDPATQEYLATVPRRDERDREFAERSVKRPARDHGRQPMQWDNTRHGGFSSTLGKTWMRVNDSSSDINVARQEGDEHSPLEFFRRLAHLRITERDVFVYGSFEMLDPDREETILFIKRGGGKVALVALNFTAEEQHYSLPPEVSGENLYLSTLGEEGETLGRLRAYEGKLYLCS